MLSDNQLKVRDAAEVIVNRFNVLGARVMVQTQVDRLIEAVTTEVAQRYEAIIEERVQDTLAQRMPRLVLEAKDRARTQLREEWELDEDLTIHQERRMVERERKDLKKALDGVRALAEHLEGLRKQHNQELREAAQVARERFAARVLQAMYFGREAVLRAINRGVK